MKPDKFDAGTTVKGLDYIDVPPNSKRDYKVNFYAHKEGITMCKVWSFVAIKNYFRWKYSMKDIDVDIDIDIDIAMLLLWVENKRV